jgi:MFS family permease
VSDIVVESSEVRVASERTPRRAAVAAWIGSSLEYYDFFIYGTASALVFPAVFFPAGNPAAATLASLATFGVGYLARPLGSILMGHIGDRVGRRVVLISTLMLMGVSTFLVGCLPGYDQIGAAAPILLVTLRMLQGISASGEQAGANSTSFEHAPDDRRAFFTSWTLSGTQAGQLIANGVFLPLAAVLPREDLVSWGWRIPFWASAVMLVVGFVIRRTLQETPAFREKRARGQVSTRPLGVLLRYHWRSVLRVLFTTVIVSVGTIVSVFCLSFATSPAYGIGIGSDVMLTISLLAFGLAVVMIPIMATLSDRFGRKPVFLTAAVVAAVMVSLFLWSISTTTMPLVYVSGVLVLGLGMSGINAVYPAMFAEMFPTEVRLSGTAIGSQFGVAVAGFAPTIAVALANGSREGWFPVAVFIVAICLIASISVITTRETFRTPLEELGRQQFSSSSR